MSLIYKEAEACDAEALLAHLKAVGKETDNLTFDSTTFNISPEREARFIERFFRSDRDIMYIAKDGDTVVANGIIEHGKIARLSHKATLSITVLKNRWGEGIGSHLMEMMISHCRDKGTAVISLECRSDNARAIALYSKFGFKRIGVSERYFKINGSYASADYMELLL